ncbi:hypothetical protein FRB98_002659 [Tulasnella sp. 332]|nr:hypothetical protein FRB98_002659 [Tulasnella sp. 332]
MPDGVKSLASDAAAVALNEKQPRRAVELLEQGRGVLLAQLVRYRTALDDLHAISPRIAAEFTELSSQLENSLHRNSVDEIDITIGASGPDIVGRYQDLTRRWNGVVRQIRELPGFTTFLQPTPFHLLLCAADKGPVVIVNISEIRSDAIILRSGAEPEIVKLPNATVEEINHIASMMENAVGGQDEGRRVSKVDEVLRLLWGCVARPIVERLEALGVVRGSHIWWCPTSRLCSLPLHAAGIYRAKQPKFPDIFISSYTPTLSALVRARTPTSNSVGRPSVLAIGVPEPAGRDGADGALLFVGKELRMLLQCSRFRLQDKPLLMQEITRTDLPDAEFAFLSACHTATGDRNTPNEGLHLAAAMQFAGFRGVVGTLWAMDDVDGPDVAESFYRYMFRNGGDGVNYEDAAKGVHEISKALRKSKVPLDRWINFIHVGLEV